MCNLSSSQNRRSGQGESCSSQNKRRSLGESFFYFSESVFLKSSVVVLVLLKKPFSDFGLL